VSGEHFKFYKVVGGVETLFRWGKKTFIRFYSKFSQETVYQVLSESPKFYGRYCKNICWSLFSGLCITFPTLL